MLIYVSFQSQFGWVNPRGVEPDMMLN